MGLKEDAHGRWPEILAAAGVPTTLLNGKHQSCPLCVTRPSRTVNKDRFRFSDFNGNGDYYCNECGPGNGLSLLMGVMEWDMKRALSEVSRLASRNLPAMSQPKIGDKEVYRKLIKFGRGLERIKESDPVHRYLMSRGLDRNDFLRIHPGEDLYDQGLLVGNFPVMVGLFQDVNGQGKGYHRTWITPEGKVRKVLGRGLSGCAIRLTPIADEIGLAEGIETAMSVTKMLGIPCWAAYSKDNMKSFEPPAGVKRVRVFADSDESYAGQKAAVLAVHDMIARGIDADLHPFLAKGDWNDVLMNRRRYGTAA